MSSMLPRWWLEPKYESLLRDADGLAWELSGGERQGHDRGRLLHGRRRSGAYLQGQPVAKKWADNMTDHYDELAVTEPIFGHLHNCMELAIVGGSTSRPTCRARRATACRC